MINPRFGACTSLLEAVSRAPDNYAEDGGKSIRHTPGMRARLESCMRTLIVSARPISYRSRRWLAHKTYPEDGKQAPPSFRRLHQLCRSQYEPWNTVTAQSSLPIKLVAAEAGFFPPGPCTDFADILGLCEVAEPGNLQLRANGSMRV